MTQTVLLGDIMSVPSRNGLTKPKRVRGSGVKMVNMGELFANQRIQNLEMDRVPLVEKERIALLEPNDLLFARQSLVFEGAGQCSIFLGDDEDVCFESHLIRVRIDPVKADPRYIFYWLLSPAGKNAISSKVEQGAGAAGIRGSDLQKVKIELPDLEAQKKIADILGTIDEKIELNRQMNETLEQMGQALFRHYFIDNPEVEKWGKTALGTKIKPRRGKSLQSKNMIPGDVPVVSGGLQPAGLHNQSNTMAPVITVSASGANAGYVALWDKNIWSADSSFIDTTITPHVYFYYLFLSRNQKRIYEMQTGSGQPHIYPSHLELLELPDAPEFLIAEFNNKVAASFEKIEANKQEIQTLTTLRDTLLPRLISGKVKV